MMLFRDAEELLDSRRNQAIRSVRGLMEPLATWGYPGGAAGTARGGGVTVAAWDECMRGDRQRASAIKVALITSPGALFCCGCLSRCFLRAAGGGWR